MRTKQNHMCAHNTLLLYIPGVYLVLIMCPGHEYNSIILRAFIRPVTLFFFVLHSLYSRATLILRSLVNIIMQFTSFTLFLFIYSYGLEFWLMKSTKKWTNEDINEWGVYCGLVLSVTTNNPRFQGLLLLLTQPWSSSWWRKWQLM